MCAERTYCGSWRAPLESRSQKKGDGNGTNHHVGQDRELDGAAAGALKSADGGDVSAEVVTEALGISAMWRQKHVARPTYEPFALQCGWSMSKEFYEWIASSWTQGFKRRNGVVITNTQRAA